MLENLKKIYATSVVINVAMLMSIVLYAAIIEILLMNNIARNLIKTGNSLNYLLLAIIFLILQMRKKLVSKYASDRGNTDENTRVQNLFSLSIISAIVFEVPALVGFVFFFVSGARLQFYLLSFFSAFMIIRHFPKFSKWQKETGIIK